MSLRDGHLSRLTNAQLDVDEFHAEVVGKHLPEDPCLPANPEMHIRLLREECQETCAALLAGDLPGIVDGAIDVIYIALGLLSHCGVAAEPMWRAVQRANMAKAGGHLDESGKWRKPAGWTPPDIEGELRRQGWKP